MPFFSEGDDLDLGVACGFSSRASATRRALFWRHATPKTWPSTIKSDMALMMMFLAQLHSSCVAKKGRRTAPAGVSDSFPDQPFPHLVNSCVSQFVTDFHAAPKFLPNASHQPRVFRRAGSFRNLGIFFNIILRSLHCYVATSRKIHLPRYHRSHTVRDPRRRLRQMLLLSHSFLALIVGVGATSAAIDCGNRNFCGPLQTCTTNAIGKSPTLSRCVPRANE